MLPFNRGYQECGCPSERKKESYTPGIGKNGPRNLNVNVCLLPNGLQRFWLHCRDRYDAVTQNQNNCAVIHLGGRDTSAFVIPSAAIARSLSLTLVGNASTVLWRPHKDSDHTAVIAIVDWRLHAKTHRAGEVVSTVISSCLTFGRHCWLDISIDDWAWSSRDMCVNWNELQYRTVARPASCNRGYQECGCPSKERKKKKMTKSDFSPRLVQRLSRTLGYVCKCFCELLGSSYHSICMLGLRGCIFVGRYPAGASVW